MDKHFVFRIVLIVLAAFVLFALINYYNSKQSVAKAEKFYQETLDRVAPIQKREKFTQQQAKPEAGVAKNAGAANAVDPSEENQSSMFRAVDFETNKVSNDCFPKDRLSADDLLPKDAANAKWAQVNPAGQGDVRDQNFLTAGALIGIDTIGSSLRNSSLDLRGDPAPNPTSGGFGILQSTISPDLLRRRLVAEADCGL